MLFLYNGRTVPLQLNKHGSVAKSVIQFLLLADEDEMWSKAVFIQCSLIAKKCFHESLKQLSFGRNYLCSMHPFQSA